MKKKCFSALALAIALVMSLSAMTFAQAAPAVGNASFQKNVEQFPGLWDAEKGVTSPVFSYTNCIREQVYVEAPVDSDEDGQRDLLKLYIYRPLESGKDGVKVPVLLHHSPYIEGNNTAVNYDHVTEQVVNPNTSHYTYDDVKTQQLQAYDWPWSDEANTELGIPASRGAKEMSPSGSPLTNNTTSNTPSASNWKSYFITRGYAVVHSGNLGTRYSQGIPSSCDVDEAVAAMAVIKWLNGEVRGYTDLEATKEVTATDWCNGNVAMEGTSYPGTTPILTACTGVKGLKAIIPKASVPNWYNYYRDNGAVHGPDLYQGEDGPKHAEFNFSRKVNNAASGLYPTSVKDVFERKMAENLIKAERDTGSYNAYWDQKNLLRNLDKLDRPGDPIGVLIMHGLNDNNVKPVMSDQLYRAIKVKAPNVPVKLRFNLQLHADAWAYGDFLNETHLWLDHFLYGIDNGALDLPEVKIASNVDGKFESFPSWPIPGSEYQKIFFRPAASGSGAGALALDAPAVNYKESFKDDLKDYRLDANQKTSTSYQNYAVHWERRALLNWDGAKPNLDVQNENRLAYVSEPLTENLRLNGTAKITLNLTPDKSTGNITAAIVEIGPNNRAYPYGDNGTSSSGSLGYPAFSSGSALASTGSSVIPGFGGTSNLTIYENYAMNSTVSQYKFVTRAHANVQKPNPSGKISTDAADTNFIPEYYYQTQTIVPGKAYSYTFEFTPMDYTFKAGQQLAVLVYSTDYRHSIIPFNATGFTMNLKDSYIEIPLAGNTLKTDVGIKLTTSADDIYEGDFFTVDARATEQLPGNLAVLDFEFDKDKFEYGTVSVPAGVTLINSEAIDAGQRVTVMVPNYQLENLASITLKSKETISQLSTLLNLTASIVIKEGAEKKVIVISSKLDFDPTLPDDLDDIDLIYLSNVIDAFGSKYGDANWNEVKKYDFNKNGKIDIDDVVHAAKNIKL